MRYTLEKLFGCCFFNKDLIRHLIVWKTLYLALTHICFSKVNGSALLKERWRKGFYFFQPHKLLGTIGYHPNIHIIECLNHSWFFQTSNYLEKLGFPSFNRNMAF